MPRTRKMADSDAEQSDEDQDKVIEKKTSYSKHGSKWIFLMKGECKLKSSVRTKALPYSRIIDTYTDGRLDLDEEQLDKEYEKDVEKNESYILKRIFKSSFLMKYGCKLYP